MIKEGFDQDNLFCIYNSLDYNHQVRIRHTLNYTSIYKSYFGNSDPVIIFIGRLTKIKKLNQLIYCLNLLHSKNFSCNLVLIGSGEEEYMLSELVSMYKLNNKVWFYGSCFKEEELANLIYNANVCVSPGNVGLTAIHCFTYGVPVITHNNFNKQVPEFEAIVPNVNGNFFKEDSIQDMCEKIIPWLKLTESQKNTIKQQCYMVVDKKYNPNNQISILKENLTFNNYGKINV
jgi:glycosyltransferase involved in cell wall biosynthesis